MPPQKYQPNKPTPNQCWVKRQPIQQTQRKSVSPRSQIPTKGSVDASHWWFLVASGWWSLTERPGGFKRCVLFVVWYFFGRTFVRRNSEKNTKNSVHATRYVYCTYAFPQFWDVAHHVSTIFTMSAFFVRQDNGQLIEEAIQKKRGWPRPRGQFLLTVGGSSHMDVSKHRGKTPKMDGENNGNPYEQMDDLGGKPTIFGNTHMVSSQDHPHLYISHEVWPWMERGPTTIGDLWSPWFLSTYPNWDDPPYVCLNNFLFKIRRRDSLVFCWVYSLRRRHRLALVLCVCFIFDVCHVVSRCLNSPCCRCVAECN